jgi:glycosyltransferase involved in cell wall biosynthesis
MKKLLFIGAINHGKQATAGAMVKNQHLLAFLQQKFKDVIFIDTINFRRNPFVLLRIFYQILLSKDNPIILSTSSISTQTLVKILVFLKIKRNILYWVIGGDLGLSFKNKTLNSRYFLYFKRIILEGEAMKKDCETFGLKNTIVVPNFKNIQYIPKKQNKNKLIRFVFLSRVMREKGVDLIIQSTKFLNESGYNNSFSVDIYGKIDDNYSQSFFEQLNEIDNIKYSGFLDLSLKSNYDLLSEYDVMLFPTFFKGEGFPGILIDAYIAGLPVIASNWNLNNEIVINEKTGILIEPDNISCLNDAMLTVLNGNINLRSMSINCRNKAADYKIENILNDSLLSELGLLSI